MQKYYCEVGYRLNKEQRKQYEDKGLFVYSTRSWDSGCGCSLEKFVLVNHESDVIMNFEALNESNDFYENDFFDFIEREDIERVEEVKL